MIIQLAKPQAEDNKMRKIKIEKKLSTTMLKSISDAATFT